MKRHWSALAGAMLLVVVGMAMARVDADPNQAYNVAPADGPWMVCVASFTGEQAGTLAHALVLELRGLDLPAFIYNRGAKERQEQRDEFGRKRQRQLEELRRAGYEPADMPLRIPTVRIEDQYAVLVGGYKDSDEARKALDRLKKLDAPKTSTFSKLFGREQQPGTNRFITSFVAPNPTLPSPPKVEKPDPFLKDLNSGESLSLLKCKKPWTLVIKTFQGGTIVQPQTAPNNFMKELLGQSSGEQLNRCAQNAHNLAEALRKMKFEAYVLHTRTSSIVCVGGFNSPDDPEMQSIRQALTNNVRFKEVQLLAQILPMEVPRP